MSEVTDGASEIYRDMWRAALDAHQASIVDFTDQIRCLRRDKADVERQLAAFVAEMKRYTAAKVV